MLKLNVGLSRKVGEPDYGSRGASVNLEVELDSAAAADPARLQAAIRKLFGVVRVSLAEELNGTARPSNGALAKATPIRRPAKLGGARQATFAQVKAINAICRSQGIDVGPLLRQQFHVETPDELSVKEASALIDDLKRAANQPAA